MLQVKDYHEKKYEGGEEKEEKENVEVAKDGLEVAKDGLGLILERWECLLPLGCTPLVTE